MTEQGDGTLWDRLHRTQPYEALIVFILAVLLSLVLVSSDAIIADVRAADAAAVPLRPAGFAGGAGPGTR